MKISKYLENNIENINKKILFLGGTAGIGKEAIIHLVQKDASIVLLARNLEKAKAFNDELKAKYSKELLDIIKYDQSDFESVDSATKIVKEKHPDFDICICNAGIMLPKKELRSKQGRSLTLDTNFVGLARFLNQIVPEYKNKKYILQGSIASSKAVLKKDILNPKRNLFLQYNTSKAGVESLFYYYSENNKDNEFILTEPGVSSTDIFNGIVEPIRTLGKALFKVIVHSPKKASLTLVKAASSTSKNGDFIVPRGLFAISGFPKYKKFPKRRIRNYLLEEIKDF